MKFIFEVNQYHPANNSNGVTITEIELYSNNRLINYNILDLFEYSSKNTTYWNNSVWGKKNLNNRNISYSSNSDGAISSALFLYQNTKNVWSRFSIEPLENVEIDKIIIYAGSPEKRIPLDIKIYKTEKYSIGQLENQNNVDMELLKVFSFDGTEITVRPFIYENSIYYLFKKNDGYYYLNNKTVNGDFFELISFKANSEKPVISDFLTHGIRNLSTFKQTLTKESNDLKIIAYCGNKILKNLDITYKSIEVVEQLDFIQITKNELSKIFIDGKGQVKIAVRFPDINTNLYIYKNNEWQKVSIVDKEKLYLDANTIDEFNSIDWSNSSLKTKLQFVYIFECSDIVSSINSIKITTNNNVISTPIINSITAKTKNFSLKGYMEKVEAKNERDFVELVFKSDTALDAKKNKMESLVVDVFNEDSVENISTKADIKETVPFIKDVDIAEGFLKSITIDSLKDIKGVEA